MRGCFDSYGIIPLRKLKGNSLEVFMVQQRRGAYWSFPKGHAELQEEPKEAAVRELQEETALLIQAFLPIPPIVEMYSFDQDGKRRDKKVTYFFAWVEGDVSLQEKEILAGKWCLLHDVCQMATYASTKNICQQIQACLTSLN